MSVLSSTPDTASRQLNSIRSLVAAVLETNRFYAGKLGRAGLTAPPDSLESFQRDFPFTTKSELVTDQRAAPPFGTNLTEPLDRYTRFHQTSGTSGDPLTWLDTPESWSGLLDSWARVFRAAGVTAADRVLFAFSFGPFLGFWTAFEAAQRIGCLCLPGGGLGSLARVRLMARAAATVLCCTPTYALRLAESVAEAGVERGALPLRRILVAGEPGGSVPEIRSRIEAAWPGARVVDHHGMTEVGPVTFEPPDRSGCLQVIEDAYFAECVDPSSGAPLPAGATGELVLTTLGRRASPLIRYRTGDLVRPILTSAPPSLLLEGGIIGRCDDMAIVRGVNVYPAAVEAIVRRHPDIAEFQVTVDRTRPMTELSLTIEPAPSCVDIGRLVAALERDFDGSLALRVPIRATEPGSLPRFEMKARRWNVLRP